MKFCWCTIMVRDMEQSLNFYEEVVRLSLERRFGAGTGMEIVFLGDGETKIELICNQAEKEVNIGHDISLGFEVDSLESMITFVQGKGISIHSGPFQPNPHVKFFYVLDPNGVKIQFVENM